MSYSQLFEQAVVKLTKAGITHAKQEALWILEYGLGVTRLDVLTSTHGMGEEEDYQRTLELIARRANREPLQYVLGTQEFCGRELMVRPGVLIPRPETELVVTEALNWIQQVCYPHIVDVGTGSGCLAISLAGGKPDSTVVAIDRSMTALHRHESTPFDMVSRDKFDGFTEIYSPPCYPDRQKVKWRRLWLTCLISPRQNGSVSRRM